VTAAILALMIAVGGPGVHVSATGAPAAWRAHGQTAGAAEVVAGIRVHGNQLTPDEEVIAMAGVAVGDPVDAATTAEITRRLEQTGRFVNVDVRRRYASIADPSQILIVIVVDEGPVRIVLPVGSGDEVRVEPKRGLRNLMYLPILDAEDGYGVTYGVRLAYIGLAGDRSRLSFPLSWGGLKQAGVVFDRAFVAGPISRLEVGAAIHRRRNPAFDEQDDRRRVWARAERQVGPVRLGASGGWQRVSFSGDDDTLRTVGIDATLDTRLDPLLPRNAVYARASVERVDYRGAGDVRRYELDGRGYVGLLGQAVLELRARRQAADRPLPRYLQPLLGGWSSLRGFRAGSFVGDTMVTGSAELHVPLTSALRAGKIGVSAFVDAGAVYAHGGRLGDAPVHVGGGGSLWFALSPFKMSLSVAHGRGAGTRVNFGGGFVF